VIAGGRVVDLEILPAVRGLRAIDAQRAPAAPRLHRRWRASNRASGTTWEARRSAEARSPSGEGVTGAGDCGSSSRSGCGGSHKVSGVLQPVLRAATRDAVASPRLASQVRIRTFRDRAQCGATTPMLAIASPLVMEGTPRT
jgi:hypothetical protein